MARRRSTPKATDPTRQTSIVLLQVQPDGSEQRVFTGPVQTASAPLSPAMIRLIDALAEVAAKEFLALHRKDPGQV